MREELARKEAGQVVELYRKYRPRNLDDLIGQDEVVNTLKNLISTNSVPHCILGYGPSGTGKTTTFRILAKMLGCAKMDFNELDAADLRGIDVVREIKRTLFLTPIGGRCKVWVLDECHQLTPQAQEGLLKILEDTPKHCYFFLASTMPDKLKQTIRTRTMPLKFKSLSTQSLSLLAKKVYKAEKGEELNDIASLKLAENADGSARMLLVLLHKVIDVINNEDFDFSELSKIDEKNDVIAICRALLDPKIKWMELAKLLKQVEEIEQDPEGIRYAILGYMKKVLLGGGRYAKLAALVIDEFRDSVIHSGSAGIVANCYNVKTYDTK